MPGGLESEFPEYFILRFLYLRMAEFDQFSASNADQMIVMRVFVHVLVAPRTFILAGVLGQPRIGQDLEGAEDSRLAEAWVDFFRCREKVLGAEVPFRF